MLRNIFLAIARHNKLVKLIYRATYKIELLEKII